MASRPTPASGQDLCKACGLCCTGVWFSHVNLESAEFELARNAGMQVQMVEGQPRAYQPCSLHRHGQCSAYHSWRPAACGEFRCRLLDHFTTGQIGFEQALGHVNAARGMAERIRAEVGNVAGGLLGPRFLSRLDPQAAPTEDDAPLPASSPTQLDAVALNRYYVRFFEREADKRSKLPRVAGLD